MSTFTLYESQIKNNNNREVLNKKRSSNRDSREFGEKKNLEVI